MRALLDVNVLIALLDADHSLHERAIGWLSSRRRGDWASTPITQNGCLRIMSHPGYPNGIPVSAVAERLALACRDPSHEFWPDDLSLLDAKRVNVRKIHGPRQLTDVYLLAIAVQRNGQLVTFDAGIALDAVHGARTDHLLQL